jgi:hypothetical protein
MDRIQELQCAPTVIVSTTTCDHQWGYASTVGNMTCIKCRAFRDHDHPDTITYLNRFPWLRK